jgi:hypothetical protein
MKSEPNVTQKIIILFYTKLRQYVFLIILSEVMLINVNFQHKQGRKRPLDTPKRMIKRRERERKREKER